MVQMPPQRAEGTYRAARRIVAHSTSLAEGNTVPFREMRRKLRF